MTEELPMKTPEQLKADALLEKRSKKCGRTRKKIRDAIDEQKEKAEKSKESHAKGHYLPSKSIDEVKDEIARHRGELMRAKKKRRMMVVNAALGKYEGQKELAHYEPVKE